MLREEIVAVVERSKQNIDAERVEINTKVVCEFYGLGISEDISGEKIAKKYGWEKKQNVDQCIKYNFINRLEEGDLNSLAQMIKKIEEKPLWTSDDFAKLIEEYVGCEVVLGNFKKLIKKLYPNTKICFVNASLKEASRQELADGKFIVVTKTNCDKMKGVLKGVGQYGLVRVDEYVCDCAKDEDARRVVEALLAIAPKTKFVKNEWYICENEDNIIFNSLRMIASITDNVRTDILEKIIYQVIKGSRRKHIYTCPTEDVIKVYLKDSIYLKQDNEYSYILVKAKSGGIEKRYLDVVNIFNKTECCELLSSDFAKYLRERGNTPYNCTSILANCPLIFTDKTAGRGKHIVCYVKGFSKDKNYDAGRVLINQVEELESDRAMLDSINNMDYPRSATMSAKKYEDKPRTKVEPHIVNKKKVYYRDPEISKIALAQADFKCEIDGCTTVLFKRRRSNVNYTEPHHIVPMAYSDEFEKISLDVPGNIISLCSQCHNKIHYGAGYEETLSEIYRKRKKRLSKCGIDVSLDDLKKYYK